MGTSKEITTRNKETHPNSMTTHGKIKVTFIKEVIKNFTIKEK